MDDDIGKRQFLRHFKYNNKIESIINLNQSINYFRELN